MAQRRKRWFKYSIYEPVADTNSASAISPIPLPRLTRKYFCAGYPRRSNPLADVMPGKAVDLVFGDPRLLTRCELVERGISEMPDNLSHHILGYDNWWTWKWNRVHIFINMKECAFAKDAKKPTR